jgi:hypothetical protein
MTTLYYAFQDEEVIFLVCSIMQTLALCYLVWRHP